MPERMHWPDPCGPASFRILRGNNFGQSEKQDGLRVDRILSPESRKGNQDPKAA